MSASPSDLERWKPTTPDYYYNLDLTPSATRGQVMKSYRKLALIHHPDKGGDATSFHKINDAFALLCDNVKRECYDREYSKNQRAWATWRDEMGKHRGCKVTPRVNINDAADPQLAPEGQQTHHQAATGPAKTRRQPPGRAADVNVAQQPPTAGRKRPYGDNAQGPRKRQPQSREAAQDGHVPPSEQEARCPQPPPRAAARKNGNLEEALRRVKEVKAWCAALVAEKQMLAEKRELEEALRRMEEAQARYEASMATERMLAQKREEEEEIHGMQEAKARSEALKAKEQILAEDREAEEALRRLLEAQAQYVALVAREQMLVEHFAKCTAAKNMLRRVEEAKAQVEEQLSHTETRKWEEAFRRGQEAKARYEASLAEKHALAKRRESEEARRRVEEARARYEALVAEKQMLAERMGLEDALRRAAARYEALMAEKKKMPGKQTMPGKQRACVCECVCDPTARRQCGGECPGFDVGEAS